MPPMPRYGATSANANSKDGRLCPVAKRQNAPISTISAAGVRGTKSHRRNTTAGACIAAIARCWRMKIYPAAGGAPFTKNRSGAMRQPAIQSSKNKLIMTTIEKRAKAFCEKNICVDCADRKDCDRKCLGTCIPTFDALEWLIQFGKSECKELTRWHNPKEKLPADCKVVLTRKKEPTGYSYLTAAYSSELHIWITAYHDAVVQCGLSPLRVNNYIPDEWQEIN